MDILIFARTFYPNIGGMEISTRIMAQELAACGFSVTVVTGTNRGNTAELEEGYQIVRTAGIGTLLAIAGQAGCVVIRGGVAASMGLAAMLRGRPVVCFHEMAGALPSPWASIPLRPGQLLANIVRRVVFRSVRLHVGVSHAVLADKGLPPAARRTVLYNPVPSALWPHVRAAWEQRDIDFLFVGRIRRSKGVFVLADALETLASRQLLPKVTIVGSGPDLPCFQERVESIGNTQVNFLGEQRDKALSHLFARARWIVVPSSTHPEGMGMVAAEGLAHGTPVIAADQPALIEVIQDCGLVYPRFDARALADVMERLHCDVGEWSRASCRAWVKRDRFSPASYRCAISKLIKAGTFAPR